MTLTILIGNTDNKLPQQEWAQFKAEMAAATRNLDAVFSALSSSSPAAPTEGKCERCGGVNPSSWHAPSPLWNAVMRVGDAPDEPFLCPTCFIITAGERGFSSPSWHVAPDGIDLDSIWTDVDGRQWDSAQCLWVVPVEEPRSCRTCGGTREVEVPICTVIGACPDCASPTSSEGR